MSSQKNNIRIGLEIHVPLNTKSKLFCSCSTDLSDEPNKNTCPVCTGFPGTKPALNKKALELAIRTCLALGCEISKGLIFSRKVYFYPDLPKSFQITQYEKPLGFDGRTEVNDKTVRIKRVQVEEDPASLKHPKGMGKSEYVLIDYNRCGVGLCEVVTEPDFISAKEARRFLEYIENILTYLQVYDSTRFSMRADLNISVGEHSRVEIKNVSGWAIAEKVLNFEIARQESNIRLGMISKFVETKFVDEKGGLIEGGRKKESSEEYGYIFEPNLGQIELDDKFLENIKKNMPELPQKRAERFVKEHKIDSARARSLVSELELSDMFEKLCKYFEPNFVSMWLSIYLKKVLNYNSLKLKDSKIDFELMKKFLGLVVDEKVSKRGGDLLLRELVVKGGEPEVVAKRIGVLVFDDREIEKIILVILDKEKKAAEDRALDYLVGQVIKACKGACDPKKVRQILAERLKKEKK